MATAGVFAGLYFIFIALSVLCSWAAVACQFVGSWMFFKKMGLPGWKGIIPFYSTYVLFDTVWDKNKFKKYLGLSIAIIAAAVVYYILLFLSMVIGIVGYETGAGTDAGIIFFVTFIIFSIIICVAEITLAVLLIILEYQLYSRLAKSFGKGTGFAFGLLFLSPVFFMILGFDKSLFLGKPAEY